MTRIVALAGIFALASLCGCPLPEASDAPDTTATLDSLAPDSAVGDAADATDVPSTGACATNRDCYTRQSNAPVCDRAAGTCIEARTFFAMPCDTSDDCRAYYNTSLVTCSQAKLCSMPCLTPGEYPSTHCGYGGERSCSFQKTCECVDATYCGNPDAVCGTVSHRCMLKCLSDLDCAAVEGTTCDLATGQCVQ